MPVAQTPAGPMAKVPPHKQSLALVVGAPVQRMNLKLILHFFYVVFPHAFFVLPLRIIWKHILMRFRSKGIVQAVGRPVFADFVARFSNFVLSHVVSAEARLVFDRTRSYDMVTKGPLFSGFKDWVEFVHVNGTAGRWIAPPNTKRSEDDIVFFYIHGGGFVLDTSGNGMIFMLALAKSMNLKRNVQCSVFCLDYELAPEFKYPSQLIETLAAYHHLVNNLGVSPDKICLSGDSAGGNLATAFLLHLARPNPKIHVPSSFGPTPKRPGSAVLISPFVKLVSHLPSRTSNADYDVIDTSSSFFAACDYIGVKHANRRLHSPLPIWSPFQHLYNPNPIAPRGLIKAVTTTTSKDEFFEDGKDFDLFNSPYVNPSVLISDSQWWKDACPGEGRTMVTWGGKEIFADDCVEFVDILDRSGVAPSTLCKPLGAHDWVLFDQFIPGSWKTNSLGIDNRKDYGVEAVADFLQGVDIANRQLHWAAVSAAKTAERGQEQQAVKLELAKSKNSLKDQPVSAAEPKVAEPAVPAKATQQFEDSAVMVGEDKGTEKVDDAQWEKTVPGQKLSSKGPKSSTKGTKA